MIDKKEIVIVGDTTKSLSFFAKNIHPDAKFFSDGTNSDKIVYTSIGDISISQFVDLLINAKKIIYFSESDKWTCDETKNITESIIYLLYINGYNSIIENFPINNFQLTQNTLNIEQFSEPLNQNVLVKKLCNYTSTNFLGTVAHRSSIRPQLWVAGCSYACGDFSPQRYGDIVAAHFKMPTTHISYSGSSIDFAADQIIKSSLKKDDVLLWGITGVNRFTWFNDGSLKRVNRTYLNLFNDTLSDTEKKFLIQMMLDDSRLHLAQRHICQIQSLCDNIGVKLILIYHDDLSIADHAITMNQFLSEFKNLLPLTEYMKANFDKSMLTDRLFLDLGEDNVHPGPITHLAWANAIIKFMEDQGIQSQFSQNPQ
jgi:hypothetical protein